MILYLIIEFDNLVSDKRNYILLVKENYTIDGYIGNMPILLIQFALSYI